MVHLCNNYNKLPVVSLYFLLYSSKLYMGIAASKSSALSIFTPLIFEMQVINGELFLNVTALFLFALSGLTTVMVPFTII